MGENLTERETMIAVRAILQAALNRSSSLSYKRDRILVLEEATDAGVGLLNEALNTRHSHRPSPEGKEA